jgi:hypothetical protein
MSPYERNFIARSTVQNSVGQLPNFGDHVPRVKLRDIKVRVLKAGFYFEDTIPAEGAVMKMPLDIVRDLEARNLVERL